MTEAGGIGLPGGSVRQPGYAETTAKASRRNGQDARRGPAIATEISTDKTKELGAQSKHEEQIRDEPLSSGSRQIDSPVEEVDVTTEFLCGRSKRLPESPSS
jgi:hypothetical protein